MLMPREASSVLVCNTGSGAGTVGSVPAFTTRLQLLSPVKSGLNPAEREGCCKCAETTEGENWHNFVRYLGIHS